VSRISLHSSSLFRRPSKVLRFSLGLSCTACICLYLPTLACALANPSTLLHSVKYPNMYANKAENKDADAFNNVQRAHQNTLENIPHFLMFLLLGGLQVRSVRRRQTRQLILRPPDLCDESAGRLRRKALTGRATRRHR
jgi:hypothetical protein